MGREESTIAAAEESEFDLVGEGETEVVGDELSWVGNTKKMWAFIGGWDISWAIPLTHMVSPFLLKSQQPNAEEWALQV